MRETDDCRSEMSDEELCGMKDNKMLMTTEFVRDDKYEVNRWKDIPNQLESRRSQIE